MHPLLVELIETMANDYANADEAYNATRKQLLQCAESTLRENGLLEKIEERLQAADSYDRQWSIIFPGISKKA